MSLSQKLSEENTTNIHLSSTERKKQNKVGWGSFVMHNTQKYTSEHIPEPRDKFNMTNF